MDTLEKLGALRTELIELAFALERQRRMDAADVALQTSHRIAELCEELHAAYPTCADSGHRREVLVSSRR